MTKRSASASLDFLSPVSIIPGLGPKRVEALNESGIQTIGDLLYCFPRSYIDRSKLEPICAIDQFLGQICTICATVKKVRFEPGRKSRLRVLVEDGTGEMELLWFQGGNLYRKNIVPGEMYLITGKVTKYGHFQMAHPYVEAASEKKDELKLKYVPVYPLTIFMREVGIQQRLVCKLIKWVIENLKHYPGILPQSIEIKKKFPPLNECIKEIHFPNRLDGLDLFKNRIKYEELYKTAVILKFSKKSFSMPGRSMNPGNLPLRFSNELPFMLTEDQNKAIEILFTDARSSKRMHRLLQADVGAGKTVVAFFSCLPALNENLQVAWLAPTEVLARQSWNILSLWLSKIGFRAALILGGMKANEKQKTLKQLLSGEINFVIGTHALLQTSVRFKNLGMVVIDEQHKFGVQQRLTLQEKDPKCDYLLMSATPIPQSLAMTLYGDLEIVTIDKGPSGRLPVSTHIVPEVKRIDMEKFIVGQMQKNNTRAYYVVPRIESDESDEPLIRDITSTFSNLTQNRFADIASGFIHGKMDDEQKQNVMTDFSKGNIQLLVSTSVIEVGIDVPEASIIVIENADRFGLAQLHQLRGRVGRGNSKSYCFLMISEQADQSAHKRLELFCKNHDGFKIAEMDLQNRGPGEISGIKQSGWGDLKMADIFNDIELFKEIQNELESIFPQKY
ncbi:MAG TPA: ATP-dependent DNA helicase RecG [Chitinispirillaceae bacterium]|nr:ATP-dependent DNA helicase RecG [Chitinispirillaceae bacterium]